MALKKESERAKEDKLIVHQILAGDSSQFQLLMDRYYDIIFYTILKMVYNKKDAEEIALEAFGRAFQNLSTYSKEYAFSTWLFTIATNRAIDHLRRQSKPTVVIEEENKDDYETVVLAGEAQSHPDEILIQRQKSGELRSLVDELKPFWQQLIEMRYYKELSYEEIAEQLEMPMGTVKNQLYRAKQKLSKLAQNRNITEEE